MENIQTKVKHIHYQSKGCPIINETWGSLVSMLDAVLCKGFNINLISKSENLEENRVKIYIGPEHGYTKDLVISIYGSTLDYFNTEFRVLDIFSEGVIIQLPPEILTIEDLTPTSSLYIKTAPLGYTNVYTNTPKTTMCFKNSSINSPGILKVIDEIPPNGYGTGWARFARIAIGKSITSEGEFVDNMKAPYLSTFPDVEKTGNKVNGMPGIHGYAKWRYNITDDVYSRECYGTLYKGTRPWEIIGDSNTFYLILNCGPDTSVLGFGNIKSEGSVMNPIVLQAANGYKSSESTDIHNHYGKKDNNWGCLLASNKGMFILTDIGGNIIQDTLTYYSTGMYIGENFKDRPWRSSEIKNYNPFSGKITAGKMYVKDSRNFTRGFHRGLSILYGNDSPGPGRMLGTDFIIINITDPFREGSAMPLLFDLKDWEVVE